MGDDLINIIEESENEDIQKTLEKILKQFVDSEISLSEEHLNRILLLACDKLQENNTNPEVKQIKAQIKSDKIILYVEKNIFKFIVAKYYIELVPYIDNNRLACEIKKVNMGNINISNESALKSIKDMQSEFVLVDEVRNCLILNIQMPDDIMLKSISIEDKKINLYIERI